MWINICYSVYPLPVIRSSAVSCHWCMFSFYNRAQSCWRS